MDRGSVNERAALSTKTWILLFILMLALLTAAAMNERGGERKLARIYVGGELEREIDLSKIREQMSFSIKCGGGENLIQVRPGGIRIAGADCPDQTCVRLGWLEGGGMPIVCLPHRLVIQLEAGAAQTQFDAVSG